MKNKMLFGLLIVGLVALFIVAFFLFSKPQQSGESSQDVDSTPVFPLTAQQKQIVTESVEETEFVKDLPENDPVEIVFYDFETGERRIRDRFLVSNEGIVSGVEPTISIHIHAGYIDDMENEDLCSVIQEANKNGDVGTYSEHGNMMLLIKYSGMLKYKSCLGL